MQATITPTGRFGGGIASNGHTRNTGATHASAAISAPVDKATNETLLNRCHVGDRAALEELLKRFQRPIFHLAYRLAGNHDDASDVAAQAFLRICQVIGTCRCAITLPAWINRIVANVFYDMCRRAKRRPAVSLDALVEETGGSFLAADETREISPTEYVEQNERKQILDHAIAELPETQRKMVRMYYQEDHSYDEIASMMGVPIGTVKSRLNRARLALQKQLMPERSTLLS